jgi:hypothetical protein
MKHVVFIISLLYFVLPTHAQHCEWDNSALIAVRPIYNGKFVENVKTELIGTDNPWSTKEETHKNGLYTIYKDNTKSFTKRNDINRIKNLTYFDFIKNDYAVITSNHFKEGLFIKITDLSSNNNGQKIATQIIPVTKENLLGLCGIREGLKNHDSLYKPIVVVLHSEMMMHPYFYELPTKTMLSTTFYTPPVVYKNDSIIFQMIQTGIINTETTQTIEHEFFKIHPYRFALQHFDSLKNIYLDEQGWVMDFLPKKNPTNTTASNNNHVQINDSLPQKIQSKKVAEAYDEIPNIKAFIAYKLANGSEGMERYYLKNKIEQFNSAYLYEYLDTYTAVDSAKLEFDLDEDRDMDYCIVYGKPKRHIEFYVFDNVLRQFVLDTLMSKAPYLKINLKERKLVIADYPMQQLSEMNVKQTFIRWNNNWQLIEWELQDYLSPHNNENEARSRRLNDTLCTYDFRMKQYIQHADYNFDGRIDTRIAYDSNVVFHNTSYYCEKFDYFIYDNEKGKAIKDELLSSGSFTFDFNNKTVIGYVTKRNYTNRNIWQSIIDKYEWIENKFVKTEITEQIQACPLCERIITITSKLIEGKWQQVDYDPGAE